MCDRGFILQGGVLSCDEVVRDLELALRDREDFRGEFFVL